MFQATGSIYSNQAKSKTSKNGRKKTVRTPENIDPVMDSVERSQKKSIRRWAQLLGLTRSSVQRILEVDLHLYPYSIQIKDKFTDADKAKSVTMCN